MQAPAFLLFADREGEVISGINVQVASGKKTEAGYPSPDGYFTRFDKEVGSVHWFDPKTGQARLLYQKKAAKPAAFPPELVAVLGKLAQNPG